MNRPRRQSFFVTREKISQHFQSSSQVSSQTSADSSSQDEFILPQQSKPGRKPAKPKVQKNRQTPKSNTRLKNKENRENSTQTSSKSTKKATKNTRKVSKSTKTQQLTSKLSGKSKSNSEAQNKSQKDSNSQPKPTLRLRSLSIVLNRIDVSTLNEVSESSQQNGNVISNDENQHNPDQNLNEELPDIHISFDDDDVRASLVERLSDQKEIEKQEPEKILVESTDALTSNNDAQTELDTQIKSKKPNTDDVETLSDSSTYCSVVECELKKRKQLLRMLSESGDRTHSSQPLPKRARCDSIGVRSAVCVSNRQEEERFEPKRLSFFQTLNGKQKQAGRSHDVKYSSQPKALVFAEKQIMMSEQSTDSISDDDSSKRSDYQNLNVPIFTTQPSQATNISWGLNRNSSLEVMATITSTTTMSNVNVRNSQAPCFPILPNIYYSGVISCNGIKISVNNFEHGDPDIEYNFLCRFNRSHAHLNKFKQMIYTTSVTASLINHYMNVDANKIRTLDFDEPLPIGDVEVVAIEMECFPGGAIFLFKFPNGKNIVHVGDLRLTKEVDYNRFLINNKIHQIYIDPSVLMLTLYQHPIDVDRYIDLKQECLKYITQNRSTGLSGIIAIGAFEIGMESLIVNLAQTFYLKIWMSDDRRAFLDQMLANERKNKRKDVSELPIYQMRKLTVSNPRKANIHVIEVENIHVSFLSEYLSKAEHSSFHRIMGIRPRACDSSLQLAMDKFCRIVDIPNPLIGDVCEYRRFMKCFFG